MYSQGGISTLVILSFWLEESNFKIFNIIFFGYPPFIHSDVYYIPFLYQILKKSSNILNSDLNSVFSLSLLVLHSLVIPEG